MDKYITNSYLKIINTLLQNNISYSYLSYTYNRKHFIFKDFISSQYNNYLKIQQLLKSKNINFTHINIVK